MPAPLFEAVPNFSEGRDEAKISVFDSGFLVGDGVWEGIRLHDGEFAFLDLHLDRLFEGAKAIDLDVGMTREEITTALRETVRRNGMEGSSGVHVRLIADTVVYGIVVVDTVEQEVVRLLAVAVDLGTAARALDASRCVHRVRAGGNRARDELRQTGEVAAVQRKRADCLGR